MTNKQTLSVAWSIPFATVIIAVLLCAIVAASPIMLIYYIWVEYLDFRKARLKIKKIVELNKGTIK